MDDLLSYRQAARLLGVCSKSVYLMVQRGELPAVRLGRRVMFDPADVQTMIERAKTRAGGQAVPQ